MPAMRRTTTTTSTTHSFFHPRQKKIDVEACIFEVTLSELAAEDESRTKTNKRPRLMQGRLDQTIPDATPGTKSLSFVEASALVISKDILEPAEIVPRKQTSVAVTTRESSSPQINEAKPPISLLQQLQSRCTMATTKLSPKSHPKWYRCPWLQLPCFSTATAMAFDQDGVLLAVATTGNNTIYVWDWDTVVASDFQGRIDRKIDVLPPMLAMIVPHHASDLRWNKDSLAVAFRATSSIHVYDMLLVSDSPEHPSAACTVLKPPSHVVVNNQGPKCISFLTDNHLVAAYHCGHVCLWNVSNLPTLVWTWKNSETVSCFLPVASNLIILGGTEGGFVLLDWKKTNRRAFASDQIPTALSCWKTKSPLQKKYPSVASRDWGVKTMQLDCAGSIPTYAVLDTIGSCRLSWITTGGWALSMDLGHCATRIPNVRLAPPEIQTRSSEGLLVATNTKKFSSPSAPIVAASIADYCSGGLLVWHMVPTATHILPHHDKRVCQEREVRIGNEIQLGCIMVHPGSHNFPASTVLQHVNLKRPPRALAIHPSNQWMLVASESSSKLLVYNARLPAPER